MILRVVLMMVVLVGSAQASGRAFDCISRLLNTRCDRLDRAVEVASGDSLAPEKEGARSSP